MLFLLLKFMKVFCDIQLIFFERYIFLIFANLQLQFTFIKFIHQFFMTLFIFPFVRDTTLSSSEIMICPAARLKPFYASKSVCPPCSSFIPTIKPLVRPECLDIVQSSLVLPLYVHHSLSLALGECLDTGHDRGYTQPYPHTVMNTLSTTVLQVHQLGSNNDLIPPGVRAERSRTAATVCIALGQL